MKPIFKLIPIGILVAALSSCGPQQPAGEGSNTGGSQDPASGGTTSLSGAGSSFAAPFLQRAAVDYNKVDPSVQVNYQSVGSGAGIKQFTQGTVDFGASDAAMTDEQIAAIPGGVVMIPETAGTIVMAYNLPGNPELNLSRDALIGIYLGKVTKWNDPAIATANPGTTLPDIPINVAYRSDGSGTTFVFTKHLAAISPEFAEKVGSGTAVNFPVGVGGKGNEGVTALIKQTPGTIGYVEFGYAEGNKLPMANYQNKSGTFVKPTIESGTSTLANVQMPENLRIWPADPTGKDDYPIATFTWLLLRKDNPNKEELDALKGYVTYVLTDAQKNAPALGYIPLPANVVEKAKAALATVN
jgi:phosphate transport system substrate-binding protein